MSALPQPQKKVYPAGETVVETFDFTAFVGKIEHLSFAIQGLPPDQTVEPGTVALTNGAKFEVELKNQTTGEVAIDFGQNNPRVWELWYGRQDGCVITFKVKNLTKKAITCWRGCGWRNSSDV
jgi:hypothetical protein